MSYQARLKKEYNKRIIVTLKEEFGYINVMQVPKLKKIVISRGVGAAVADKKLIDYALDELTGISGQKAIATISKKMSLLLSSEKECLLELKLPLEVSVCMNF